MPTGITQYSNIFYLRGSVDPLSFLSLATELYWISVENYGHASGIQMNDFQVSVSVTVRADL
ncbi:MAG: hypothetical protein ABSF77_10065 [Spirochaetia bacterium]|jgi:hypothetical protein